MFGRKKDVSGVTSNDKVDTIIGKDTQISGEITVAGIIQIQGKVEGNIHSIGDVILAEGSLVKGDISAVNVVITGTHIGNCDLKGRLEIGSTGKVSGDIRVGSLVIEEGGTLDGKCEMYNELQGKDLKLAKLDKSKAISDPT